VAFVKKTLDSRFRGNDENGMPASTIRSYLNADIEKARP
jgi:hypothetical protein